MNNRDPVRIYYNWIERSTEKAHLIHIPGKPAPEWFPFSEIIHHSLLDNYIEVPRWMAKKKGIKAAETKGKPIPKGLTREPEYSRKRKRSDRP